MPLFRWENFTTANGLPDNHVFCVLVDGDRIWAGTENGLGLYENGAWKIFRPDQTDSGASGRAFARARQAHRRRVGRHHGRAQPHLRRSHRHLHATQLRPEQRHRLWRRRAGRFRLDRHRRRRQPPEHAHRPVVALQRTQHARCTRSGPTPSVPRRTRSTTRSGAAACSSTTRRPSAGKTTTIPTAKPKWCC